MNDALDRVDVFALTPARLKIRASAGCAAAEHRDFVFGRGGGGDGRDVIDFALPFDAGNRGNHDAPLFAFFDARRDSVCRDAAEKFALLVHNRFPFDPRLIRYIVATEMLRCKRNPVDLRDFCGYIVGYG